MTLPEWIDFLSEQGITAANTPELYREAVSATPVSDILAKILNIYKEMGCTVQKNSILYSTIMINPSHAENHLLLSELLHGAGANFTRDNRLYLFLMSQLPEKPHLISSLKLLKEHHLTLPECEEHYYAAASQSAADIKLVLYLIMNSGAVLPVDNWFYLLAINYASSITRDPGIFTLLKKRGITPSENRYFFELLLSNVYDTEQISTKFDTLDRLGLNTRDHKELYLVATYQHIDSKMILSAFDKLAAIGADVKEDPEIYIAAVAASFNADDFPIGFSALQKAGAPFSPENKKIYLTLLDCAKTESKVYLLVQGFSILSDAGISYSSHPDLYDAMIHCPNNQATAASFVVLKEERVPLPACESLYLKVIECNTDSTKLAQGFKTLNEFGYSLPRDKALYEKMITVSHDADKLAPVLQVLKEKGVDLSANQDFVLTAMNLLPKFGAPARLISCFQRMNINGKEHPELYLTLMNHIWFADSILQGWNLLNMAGFGMESKEVYLLLAERLCRSDQLNSVLADLVKQGAQASVNKELFTTVIELAFLAYSINIDFILLNQLGLNPKDWGMLYLVVVKNLSLELTELLQKMQGLSFNIAEQPALIHAMLLNNRYSTSLSALSWLNNKGFHVTHYPDVYKIFFLNKPCLCDDPYILRKVEDAIDLYLKDKRLRDVHEAGFKEQNHEIQSIITAIVTKHNEITQGPLYKSAATKEFELILKKIAQEGIDKLDMNYDPAYGYVLTFHDEDIYLNELLRLVNFSHLELDREKDIIPLGELIEQLIPGFKKKHMEKPHIILDALPIGVEQALSVYTSEYYLNINRIFRGISQNAGEDSAWVKPVNGRTNLLASFLCGCLVNWAAAELPRALIDSPERRILRKVIETENANMDREQVLQRMKSEKGFYEQLLKMSLDKAFITQAEYQSIVPLFGQLDLLFPHYEQVLRIENIEEAEADGHFNVRKSREANPVHASSVMSASSGRKSALSIVGDNLTLFAAKGFDYTPMIGRSEREVLSPLGTAYLYSSNNQGGFFARAVNSPDVVPQGGYWSALALIEANKNHLQKPYTNAENKTVVDGVTITRANHGLPHEYRVMCYIDMVIEYYSLHAQDDEFKKFCQQISFREREWLRVVAAYSVTGRESEIGAAEHLALYDTYREASCNHLRDFLKKCPPEISDEAMTERMVYLVRWMGNPSFETGIKDQQLGNSVDGKERQHRNFLNRILSTAHKLDLPRCYAPDEFDQAMSLCRKSSQPNEQQKQDYTRMVRYAIELNRAHGDMLQTDINAEGELIMGTGSYRSPFGKIQCLRTLHEVTSTVPRPKFDKVEMEQASQWVPTA